MMALTQRLRALFFVRHRGTSYKVEGDVVSSSSCSSSDESVGEEEEEEEEAWVEAAVEAEDEAFVLICGYLWTSVVTAVIVGKILPLELEDPQNNQHGSDARAEVAKLIDLDTILSLGTWCIGFWLLTIVTTVVRASVGEFTSMTGRRGRLLANLQSFFVMCSAMLVVRTSSWIFLWHWVSHEMLAHQLDSAYVASAVVLSALTVLTMIGINAIAECLMEPRTRGLPMSGSEGQEALVAGAAAENHERDELDSRNVEVGDMPARRRGARMSSRLAQHLYNSDLNEKTVRVLVSGLGVGVGLSWELAFNVAEDTAAGNLRDFQMHPVLTKLSIALVASGLAMPTWMRFIAPMAQMHQNWHQRRIDDELKFEADNPQVRPHFWKCVVTLCVGLCCCCFRAKGKPRRSCEEADFQDDEEDGSSDD